MKYRTSKLNSKPRTRRTNKRNDSVGAYFGDAWSLAKRTANGLNEIRKLINIETKTLDTSLTATTVDQTGFVQSATSISQGLNYVNRIGDSIKLQHIRFSFYLQVSAASISSSCRVILFRDLFQQGVLPTTSQILQNVGAQDAVLQPRNRLLQERFSILFDQTYELSNTGPTCYVEAIDFPHEGHVKYLGTGSTATDNGFGSIYVMYVSTEATNKPTVQHFTRVLFTDD